MISRIKEVIHKLFISKNLKIMKSYRIGNINELINKLNNNQIFKILSLTEGYAFEWYNLDIDRKRKIIRKRLDHNRGIIEDMLFSFRKNPQVDFNILDIIFTKQYKDFVYQENPWIDELASILNRLKYWYFLDYYQMTFVLKKSNALRMFEILKIPINHSTENPKLFVIDRLTFLSLDLEPLLMFLHRFERISELQQSLKQGKNKKLYI
jgi:hypothetical protein